MAALKIPLTVDLEQFADQMKQTTALAGTATRQIAKQFLQMSKDSAFKEIGLGALRLMSTLTLVVGSVKLLGDAIQGARAQMKAMVDLADKAQNLGVSPRFLQGFQAEAQKLRVKVDDLDDALVHAFDATKDQSPIDVSQWETGKERITDVEKALRVYNETLAKAKGQQLNGLVLFRNADSQEEKIRAVLSAMIQLDQIGQHAASLDIGEKMFGSQFVDRIRQGKTSADGLLATIDKMKFSQDGVFSNDLVNRAKSIDDQLKLAEDRLSRGLKPEWDELASSLLTMKGYWADIVGLIAKAAEFLNQLNNTSLSSLTGELEAIKEARKNQSGLYGLPRIPGADRLRSLLGRPSIDDDLRRRQEDLENRIYALQGGVIGPTLPAKNRGTGPAPTKRETGGTGTDRFETSADSIEKRTAALAAEAATIDQGTAARERSKIVAQLETVAKQANAAAGKGENVVTEEQRSRINEVADAYSKAALAIEKAKLASDIKFNRQTALLDPSDVAIAQQLRDIYPDVATALNSTEAAALRTNDALKSISSTASNSLTTGLTDILDGTKSLSQGFTDMSKAIVRALEEAMIKMLIVQPIMRSLGSVFGFADGGPVSSVPIGNYSMPVFRASGGPISGPGGPRDDKIPAMLSDGEFVVNAAATQKHRALLEAINGGAPRFADGGGAGMASGMAAGNSITIAPSIAVTVQGTAGATGQEHAAMGEKVAKAAGEHIRKMIGQELRTAIRPGGFLSGRR